MAGDAAFTMTLFFFSLLLASHLAMAGRAFSPTTSSKDNAKKRNNTLVAASSAIVEEKSTQNLKTSSVVTTPKQQPPPLKDIHHVEEHSPRPPMHWQNKIFNTSEHEVPSGPNPISNR